MFYQNVFEFNLCEKLTRVIRKLQIQVSQAVFCSFCLQVVNRTSRNLGNKSLVSTCLSFHAEVAGAEVVTYL